MTPILSHYQATVILKAKEAGETAVSTSVDLNKTTAVLPLTQTHVLLPDGQQLTWEQLHEMVANPNNCYTIEENEIEKVQFFSEVLQRAYSLYPTQSAPTMLVAGFPMHRIKGTDPWRDTASKIKVAAPSGSVLDTTMGLGYTAIRAAETAVRLTTIELDPTVEQICRRNPWSQPLFTNPKINRVIGDAFDVVETLEDASYQRIIHDPPTFSLAGHLYSADFYRELWRILQPKGRVFHYIADPKSRSGRSITRGVVQRLQQSGFRRVKPAPQAFGVVAYK
ncbi:MAG: spermine synthase [Chloroflexota bacterium]